MTTTIVNMMQSILGARVFSQRLGHLLALAMGTLSLLRAQGVQATNVGAVDQNGEIPVVISPFEVRGDRQGYYSANTMAGTRLNSKVEDLAASLTVVTKAQMADFAALDINDIFLYEAGTEGTGTFTDFAVDRNGAPIDNTQLDPNNANRVRGLGPANISFGNYETSGRVPIDPSNIDAVEISRGPNANIFGLGGAAGTVNLQPSSANLTRNRSEFSVRFDSFDGYRTGLDLNRVLRKNILAIRGSAVFQHDGFVRKPSGTDTTRLNGMVKYQPFKFTTLKASYSYYKISGNRPNTSTPRDAITGWLNAGSPTWNPVTSRVTLNGVPSAGTFSISTIPSYFSNSAGTGRSNSTMFVNGNGAVGFWGITQATTSTTPASRDQSVFLVNTAPEDVRTNQPLFSSAPSISNRAIYDWSQVNLAAVNRLRDRTLTGNVEAEQIFLNTRQQTLALQVGFLREDSQRYRRDLVGRADSQGASGNLVMDVNERLPDGTVNPFFLRPFIGVWRPLTQDQPYRRETYRAQLAYKLDLRSEKGALHWLGLHQFSTYAEYKDTQRRQIAYRDVIVDGHAWLAPGFNRASSSTIPTISYFRYYVGDNVGSNADYGPAPFAPGQYDYRWGNALTGAIRTEPSVIGPAYVDTDTAGNSNLWNILKTKGAVAQSFLLQDRMVTTFGLREDRNYNRTGVTPTIQPDGITISQADINRWAPGDWAYNSGKTKTAGVVVKPLRWLSLHTNTSDSFQPSSPAVDLHLQKVPDPTGKGRDYGFGLNLLDGKLVVRVTRYDTKQFNARDSQSTTLATRARGLDFDTSNRAQTPFNLVPLATTWVTNAARVKGQTLTQDQINSQVATLTGLDPSYLANLNPTLAEVDNVRSKGTEFELNYNPTNFWTAKLNLTEQESSTSAIAPGLSGWVAERLTVWQKLIDPELNVPWFTNRYGNLASASDFLAASVTAPLNLAKATEGKSRPQIRKYRVNLLNSYRLAGLTEHPMLKRFSVGGALRWEDKGAIGYYGVQQLPAQITDLDPNRPIYDKARWYADAFVAYRMRLFSEKIGATLQLNVRNLQEGGRLQAISAYPNGRPSAFRIVDPRQFIFTATFDL